MTSEIEGLIMRCSKLDLPEGKIVKKIIVVGSPQVGKTTLIRRFATGAFDDLYIATIGVDITQKEYNLGPACTMKFVLWDVAGQDSWARERNRFFNGASAALVIFDKTRKETFEQLDYWVGEVRKYVRDEIPIIIAGNKLDLRTEEQVDEATLEAKARPGGFLHIETSAKTGENVDDAFVALAYKILFHV